MSQKLYSSFILILIFAVSLFAFNLNFEQTLLQSEEDNTIVLSAKALAIEMNQPVSITLSNGTYISVIAIENAQPVYAIYTNSRHPFQGGSLAFFAEIEASFDLSSATIYYGNHNWQNKPHGPQLGDDILANQVLLMPDWTNDRVLAINAQNGDLISMDFIPDSPELASPKQALMSPWGTITVSDQLEDLVQEFDTNGNFIQSFAPAGGVNTAIADNMRGHNYTPAGNLVVCVASGANADAVPEFDQSGNYVGNFIAAGAGGMDSPYALIYRASDILISASTSDAIHRFDLSGTYLDNLVNGLPFPQQIHELANNNIAVAQFGTPNSGLHIYDASGTFVTNYTAITGNRGVYELGNGNFVSSNGAGMHEINGTNGTYVREIAGGVSGQFFGYADLSGSSLNPPTNLVANPGNAVVNLGWTAPAALANIAEDALPVRGEKIEIPNNVSDATLLKYYIYRAENAGSFSLFDSADVAATTYSDMNVVNGTPYHYYLKAVYTEGLSEATATVTATPMAPQIGIVFEETFADTVQPADWLVVDNDGSGAAWEYRQQVSFTSGDLVNPQAGQSFWFSNYNNANSAGLIDEWLISPMISASSYDSLFLWAGAIGGSYDDSIKVWVSTTDTQLSSFTQIGYFKADGPTGSWYKKGFDLSQFSSPHIYVAANYYIRDGGPVGTHSDNVWVDHFIVTGGALAVDPIAENIPTDFALAQNYPNPFNPSTKISYAVKAQTDIRIDVFNLLGEKVATLVNDVKDAGNYNTMWNGKNDAGQKVASGIYLYRIQAGEFTATRKMMLMK